MKRSLIILLILFLTSLTYAQNVGIGVDDPQTKLQVQGVFAVTGNYSSTETPPGTVQSKTMVNGSLISFGTTDTIGRIYDPGGR